MRRRAGFSRTLQAAHAAAADGCPDDEPSFAHELEEEVQRRTAFVHGLQSALLSQLARREISPGRGLPARVLIVTGWGKSRERRAAKGGPSGRADMAPPFTP